MPLNHNDQYVVNAAQPSRRQIIEFKLSEEVLEEILNGNESIQLDMNQAKMLIGGTPYDFTQMPGISNIEVYRLPSGSRQLDLVGNITSKCTIQKTHAKKGEKKPTKIEHIRTTQIIDPRELKKPKPTAHIPVRRPQPPSSPSPTVVTTTATTATTATTSASGLASGATAAAAAAVAANVVPARTRVVQLLALHAQGTDEKELLKTKVTREELHSILHVVANAVGGRYVMKPEIYKEVKIYDWKSYSKPQRETVHTNASAAFDKLGLGPDAPERDILMPERIKRASPPLVAEGSHVVVGNMDTKWRPGGAAAAAAAAGGGGSESEGFEKNSLLKPGTTKKPLVKKQQGASQSSKKSLKGSTNGSKGTRQSTSTTIMEVANHSKGATTPTGTLKSGAGAGGTPSVGVGSPTVPIRRTSISNGSGNGNGTTNNSGGSNGHGHGHSHSGSTSSLKRPLESSKKSSSKEGGNGYKIPKVGSATSVSKKPLAFTVPPITTQSVFEEFAQKFSTKYQEMKSLKAQIDKKKALFDQLGAELGLAMGTDREVDLKRKVQEAFEDDVVDRKVLRRNGEPRSGISAERAQAAKAERSKHLSVNTMVERYKNLHFEVDTIKRALWEASNAQADRIAMRMAASAAAGNG
ncbi:MAG: hypothetical protein J3Q66DRAFT_324535 [Benniella sp.]|nr:MAG: hypothetical protein J3Q66DRAFT_324535 [Benniella sp.]